MTFFVASTPGIPEAGRACVPLVSVLFLPSSHAHHRHWCRFLFAHALEGRQLQWMRHELETVKQHPVTPNDRQRRESAPEFVAVSRYRVA